MKFKIIKPTSGDAGHYCGIPDSFKWESTIDAEYQDSRKRGIYVRGDEFIKLGGCPEAFKGNRIHLWGTFEEVL